jgi:hypothetical protein
MRFARELLMEFWILHSPYERAASWVANFKSTPLATIGIKMVLPDRIELSTSPLPMECSTTELRQHAPDPKNRPKRPYKAADPCHKVRVGASTGKAR